MVDDSRAAPSGSEALDELVFEYLELCEQGQPPDLDRFCHEHPEHSGALRQRVLTLHHAGLIAPPRTSREDPAPERLGEFRLIERLGGGGMGVVYRAEQTTLARTVALKLIRPEQLYFPGARERFRREVEAVARLAHPSIVPVYTVGEEQGVPYFAMELVEGRSLADCLAALSQRVPRTLTGRDLERCVRGDAAPSDAPLFADSWVNACLRIVRQVALALEHAHERGVLHRDVKPSNVMLTPSGEARLFDFGLATQVGAQRLTRTGSQLGSLAYMAPEQFRGGLGDVTARSDVYSLGVTLYEMLTLRLPYASESATAMLEQHGAGQPQSLRGLNPAASADAETLCLVAMDPDPARRYASARAFAEDVERALELRPIAARRASTALRVRRWAQRNPARAVAVALAGLVVVGGPLAYAVVERGARARVERANDDLRRANTELARAKGEIELKNTDLQSALARVEAQRARAENNFDRSLRAVDSMLTEVGADDLRDAPQMEAVRTKLLDKALGFYEELLAEKPGDFDIRQEQARLGRALGDVFTQLGRTEEAKRSYREQIDRFRALSEENPTSDDHRYSLASCRSQLAGILLTEADGNAEAEQLLTAARATLTELASAHPERPTYAHDLIVVLQNLSLVARNDGRGDVQSAVTEEAVRRSIELAERNPDNLDFQAVLADAANRHASCLSSASRVDDSEVEYRRAFDTLERLLRAQPANRNYRNSMCETSANYALLLGQIGKADEAERVLARGVDVGESLTRDFPSEPRYRMSLAVMCINLGAQVGARGRTEEARAALERARAPLEQLITSYPDVVEYHYYFATVLQNIASLLIDTGDVDGALAEVEHSLAEFDAALRVQPDHTAIKAQRGFSLIVLADVRRRQGRRAEALRQAAEIDTLDTQRSDLFAAQAELYSACAGQVASDTSMSQDERTNAERDDLDRSVAALRKAIAGGYRDVDYLRSSPKFERLRRDARFEPMLAEMAALRQ